MSLAEQISTVNQLFNYLINLDFKGFFVVLFNTYMPYGLPFWLLGFILMFITHLKTKNLAFAGIISASYFFVIGNSGLVTNAISATAMQYVGLLIGLIIGFYLYRTLRG